MPNYLAVINLATAGLNGALLGSDEEEIVILVFVIVDVASKQVVGIQEYFVKPRAADINENVLSEQARDELGLREDQIRAGKQLEDAVDEFDRYARSKLGLGVGSSRSMVLVTDGQLPLRQCLHPEACTKGLDLPDYYNSFYDLRKEVARSLNIAASEEKINSVRDALMHLQMESDPTPCDAVLRDAKDMGRIVVKLLEVGCFTEPEPINSRLEPGICTKDEEVDSNTVVRARGLPWQSSDQDIARFFRGLNVARGGVALCLSPQGRRNGEALVRFVSCEHRDMALKRHKHHIGSRYIEVYKATGEDFVNVAGGSNDEATKFLSRKGQMIVRMRGLPYDCTAKQIVDFFQAPEDSCDVLEGEDGVLFVKKPDGRATGDAFVMFESEEEGQKALKKHKQVIGSRYIELFRSTIAEVQQVLNRSMDPKTYEQQTPLITHLPPVPILPQQAITSGTRKDCIRLRGLPYEAQVEHILDFLGEHSKNIAYQGVHMVFNAQGQPSGEAFIQMDSEQSAFAAAQQRHHRYMVFGKKQRYVEVFQCSGDDMHLVLTGGLALPSTTPPKALLSPSMLTVPIDPLATAQAYTVQKQQELLLMGYPQLRPQIDPKAANLAVLGADPFAQFRTVGIPTIPGLPGMMLLPQAFPGTSTRFPMLQQIRPGVIPGASLPAFMPSTGLVAQQGLLTTPPPTINQTQAVATASLKRSWESAFPSVADSTDLAAKRQLAAVSAAQLAYPQFYQGL